MNQDLFTDLTHPQDVISNGEDLYTSYRPFYVSEGMGGTRLYSINTKNQGIVAAFLYGRNGEYGWHLHREQALKLAKDVCAFLNGEAA